VNIRILFVTLILAALATGCGSGTGGSSAATGELRVRVTAGPTCPVETMPPDPKCAPHAVQQAVIVLEGPEHISVDVRDGIATVNIPAGTYKIVPKPVPGLMGTPQPTTVKVVAGHTTPVRLSYDTGIR
jgi:hypothetical protein